MKVFNMSSLFDSTEQLRNKIRDDVCTVAVHIEAFLLVVYTSHDVHYIYIHLHVYSLIVVVSELGQLISLITTKTFNKKTATVLCGQGVMIPVYLQE